MTKIIKTHDLQRKVEGKPIVPHSSFVKVKKNLGQIRLIIFGCNQKRTLILYCIGPKIPDPMEVKFDK